MAWHGLMSKPWLLVGCYDANSNCQFVADLINAIRARRKGVGIYASRYMWQSIFGSLSGCPSVASQQLWYAHYDGWASLDDFQPFGGWSLANIKQFHGETTLCGAGADKNFYPWFIHRSEGVADENWIYKGKVNNEKVNNEILNLSKSKCLGLQKERLLSCFSTMG